MVDNFYSTNVVQGDLLDSQYDRQTRLWGVENQEMIYNSKVLVVGSGPLSQMVASNLAGLGIGNLILMDNKRIKSSDKNDFLCFKTKNKTFYIGNKKINRVAEPINKLNSDVTIQPIHSKFSRALANSFNPEFIVDATNDFYSKERCFQYSKDKNIKFISASSNQNKGFIYLPKLDTGSCNLEDKVLQEFRGQEQGNYTSGVMAGLVTDEIRKSMIHITCRDDNLESGTNLIYNSLSKTRLGLEDDLKKNYLHNFSDFKALVVGAGAIGNFVALNLALQGFGHIDIMDYDTVQRSNLSRQVLFYDSIGKHKADVLSQRVKEMNPQVDCTSFDKRFSNSDGFFFEKNNYDLVFSCVDNLDARKTMNSFAKKYGVTLIDGGTSATSGKVNVFVPGFSRCLDCQSDLSYQETPVEESASCINQPNPSLVIPNIIIGSMMVAEASNILYNKNKSNILDSTLKFDSFFKERIFLEDNMYNRECDCYK